MPNCTIQDTLPRRATDGTDLHCINPVNPSASHYAAGTEPSGYLTGDSGPRPKGQIAGTAAVTLGDVFEADQPKRTCVSCQHIRCAGKCEHCATCDAVSLRGRPGWEDRQGQSMPKVCEPARAGA